MDGPKTIKEDDFNLKFSSIIKNHTKIIILEIIEKKEDWNVHYS